MDLSNAVLTRCSFEAADLRNSTFRDADLGFCNLKSANFRKSNFKGAKLGDADLNNADLNGANLRAADLSRADLANADLRDADLGGIRWDGNTSMRLANVFGARNAPDGFMTYALAHGAVAVESDDEWARMQNAAQ